MLIIDLFGSQEGDRYYKLIKNSSLERKNEINQTYLKLSDHKMLDKKFLNDFPKSCMSRLWELLIASKIYNSDYKNKLRQNNGKGPDFIVNDFKQGKNLFIECVCPNAADNQDKILDKGDFNFEEEGDLKSSSSVSSGICNLAVSRFTSSLLDKSKKFEGYMKKGLIEKNDIKVLCILGAVVAADKASRHHSKLSKELCVSSDFHAAVFGTKNDYFDKREDTMKTDYIERSIETKGEPITAGLQEYLGIFDVIIFSECMPFFSYSTKEFEILYRDNNAISSLNETINHIFG